MKVLIGQILSEHADAAIVQNQVKDIIIRR